MIEMSAPVSTSISKGFPLATWISHQACADNTRHCWNPPLLAPFSSKSDGPCGVSCWACSATSVTFCLLELAGSSTMAWPITSKAWLRTLSFGLAVQFLECWLRRLKCLRVPVGCFHGNGDVQSLCVGEVHFRE